MDENVAGIDKILVEFLKTVLAVAVAHKLTAKAALAGSLVREVVDVDNFHGVRVGFDEGFDHAGEVALPVALVGEQHRSEVGILG
jgi:hypothetical protein